MSRTFNQVAYRVLKLLQWLALKPMSLEEINQQFQADTAIGKTVSQDTMGLYMNTLRAMGCKVERPKPKNQFKYRLCQHPFSYELNRDDLFFLNHALLDCEDPPLNHHQALSRMMFLLEVVEHASNVNRHDLIKQLKEEWRASLEPGFQEKLMKLEQGCLERALIPVVYQQQDVQQAKSFILSPRHIFYYKGSFYVQGFTTHHQAACLYLIDRLTLLPDDQLGHLSACEDLKERHIEKTKILLRIYQCRLQDFVFPQQPADIVVDLEHPNCLLVEFYTSLLFFLRQSLLESGYEFEVLTPNFFRDDMISFLEEVEQAALIDVR